MLASLDCLDMSCSEHLSAQLRFNNLHSPVLPEKKDLLACPRHFLSQQLSKSKILMRLPNNSTYVGSAGLFWMISQLFFTFRNSFEMIDLVLTSNL